MGRLAKVGHDKLLRMVVCVAPLLGTIPRISPDLLCSDLRPNSVLRCIATPMCREIGIAAADATNR
jgi:hypothetical protein